GACGCCGMGAVADQKGNLYLLYRSAREVIHRDMYLLVSQDRGMTFPAMDVQPWDIGACPMKYCFPRASWPAGLDFVGDE
ncbi:MAG: hypothetical protein ACR2JB_10980, partial [Bryobacteraceae bacterium]